MPHDPVLIADTEAWFLKVSLDLRSAQVDAAADPPILEDILFHAQQAAEKAMKGFLTWHQQPFGKTHDLRQLARACRALDPTLESVLATAIPLTSYAWTFRYPGHPENPTSDEAQEALAVARETVDAIVSRLPERVRAGL